MIYRYTHKWHLKNTLRDCRNKIVILIEITGIDRNIIGLYIDTHR